MDELIRCLFIKECDVALEAVPNSNELMTVKCKGNN